MSDENQQSTEQTLANQTPSELDLLKTRAKLLGIQHSPNIGVDALKEKIKEATEGTKPKEVEVVKSKSELENELRAKIISENMRMVRIKITNLNPDKKDLDGEILTISNKYLGTVRKYIPFGQRTENGWHVPYCLFVEMKNKVFLQKKTKTNKQTGQIDLDTHWAPEFALVELPPLTEEELQELAVSQMSAGL